MTTRDASAARHPAGRRSGWLWGLKTRAPMTARELSRLLDALFEAGDAIVAVHGANPSSQEGMLSEVNDLALYMPLFRYEGEPDVWLPPWRRSVL